MKALVTSPNGCQITSIHLTDLKSDEVLVRIKSAALCRTDLYVASGEIKTPSGRVLGHEASGIVAAIGDQVTTCKVEQHVSIIPLRHCGLCQPCLESQYHLCTNHQYMGVDYDGVFAEYTIIKQDELILLPKDLNFQLSGRISDITLEILQDHGYNLASQFNTSKIYDVVIECHSSVECINQAIDALRPNGLLIVKSRSLHDLQIPTMKLLRKRIKIEGIYYANFSEALAYLLNNKDKISHHIGNSYAIEQHAEAFHEARSSEQHKIFFSF